MDLRTRVRSLLTNREYWILVAILLAALINGLVFLFVVPPWQHYDEPTNFEYAWLFANRPGRPQPGDYDADMRRQVAASMIAHGFWDRIGPIPDLDVAEDPVWIGISQIEDRPLAYWIASLPLRLLKARSVTNQLYAGRFVSVIFYLLMVMSAWGILREVTQPGNQLRWVFPLSLAIFPGLGNLMSSMNNDAAAIGLFSLFLWICVRLLQRGFSWFGLLVMTFIGALCMVTKITVYFSFVLMPFVLYFSLLKGKSPRLVYGLLAGTLVMLAIASLTGGDAAAWYRSTLQVDPLRVKSNEAIAGEYVFAMDPHAKSNPTWHSPLFQPLLLENVEKIQGQTVTLGAWIWATQPGEVYTPTFGDGIKNYRQKVNVTTEPKFFTLKAKVNEKSFRAYILLPSSLNPKDPQARLFFDGIILLVGDWPSDETPVLLDPAASQGTWGGEPFTNLLRNASAEKGSLRVRPWLDKLVGRFSAYYSGPSFSLHYLLDLPGIAWHYRMTGYRLFRTFWGEFGWGNVPLLLGSTPYRTIGYFTALALIGAFLASFRHRKELPWNVLILFGLALAGVWGIAFLRGTSHISVTWFYLPVARYGYPVIIPTLLVICIGAIELLRRGAAKLRLHSLFPYLLYLAWFLLLDIVALYSISTYYNL